MMVIGMWAQCPEPGSKEDIEDDGDGQSWVRAQEIGGKRQSDPRPRA